MPQPPHTRCAICRDFGDVEHGFQKGGQPQYDAFLPPAAARLEVEIDFKPGSDRARQLQRCPKCKTWYLYETDYEFIVPGTEDEQKLTRLSEDQAKALRAESKTT